MSKPTTPGIKPETYAGMQRQAAITAMVSLGIASPERACELRKMGAEKYREALKKEVAAFIGEAEKNDTVRKEV